VPAPINPNNRRRARERAVQFLFSIDFTKYAWRDELASFWEMNPSKSPVKFYAERLIAGTCENLAALDEEIAASLDNWSLDRIGAVERASLRVALFEMRHCPDVPPSVVINEAIEVAKVFGNDESPRFINGVLERLRKAGESPEALVPESVEQ